MNVQTTAAIGPWGHTLEQLPEWLDAGCPAPSDGHSPLELPMTRGFIESRFISLVDHALTTCLTAAPPDFDGENTAVVLATILGDTTTADKASAAVGASRRPQPLLFYQSVPTSVLGHVSRQFGITGPLVCVSGGANLYQDAMETAELLFLDGHLRHLQMVYIDLGTGPRPQATLEMLAEDGGEELAAPWECCIAALTTAGDEPVSVDPPGGTGGLTAAHLPRPMLEFLRLALRRSR
ncbi:hypothetical protein [Krasilnikovia sp. M28-CT-15]|uniref:hypothetical protein n=1 Tax=Krasilnikovia sp. M28-CT-15 TaxID=3373540 RepID=UPI003875BF0E